MPPLKLYISGYRFACSFNMPFHELKHWIEVVPFLFEDGWYQCRVAYPEDKKFTPLINTLCVNAIEVHWMPVWRTP